MTFPDAERIRFLFRSDQGRIDRATWARGVATLAAVLALFTLIWFALEPYTEHDLSKSPLFVPQTAAAYAYVIFYAFVVLLIAISYVNLSAKRFRDRGHPAPLGLASLVSLFALFAGAAHLLQPRVAEVMSRWYVWGLDAAFIVAVLWTFVELGYLPSQDAPK